MNELSNFISAVGYPIAIACGSLYIIYKVLLTVFNKFVFTLDEITATNKLLAEGVVKEMDKVNTKLDYIIEKVK